MEINGTAHVEVDMLRDEGRAYARRLHDDGVAVEEVRYAGQPHGFLNFGFPAAGQAYGRISRFVRGVLGASEPGPGGISARSDRRLRPARSRPRRTSPGA